MASKAETPVSAELFRRYVSFAKRWVHPQLSEEAARALMKNYIDLRNQGTSREMITATPRILESLIRISESVAKMELREEVSIADVDEAVRLLRAATYAAAVDPETGLIDMEQLIVGVGAAKRKRGKEIESMMQMILADALTKEGTTTVDALKLLLNEQLGEKQQQLASEAEFGIALKVAEQAGLCRKQGRQIEA